MVKTKTSLILAIETSCDETAAAVLSVETSKNVTSFPQTTTLSSVIKSQIKLHSKMGGVVPEAAARAHVKNILPVVKKALRDASTTLHSTEHDFDGRQKNSVPKKIDYIAVTQGPGLIPSLIIGVEFAKALALASNTPLIAINHMEGHLYSPFTKVKTSNIKNLFPHIALIVSGGHTMIVMMKNLREYQVIGQTVDDAAGEAFDKVAKLLKLPYPGGPEVSKLAERGSPNFIFPRPMIYSKDYNFSFAGLKTAVLYHVRDNPKVSNADVCKAFQDAAVDVLTTKTMRAVKEFNAKSVSISGGVSANSTLQNTLSEQCKKASIEFFIPNRNLSTDNAEMIGLAAAVKLTFKNPTILPAKLQADPNLEL